MSMSPGNKSMWRLIAMAVLSLMFHSAPAQNTTPKISIIDIPHAGKGGEFAMERIAGKISGGHESDYRIVLYALAGGKWWVQPYADSPFTDIDASGKWHSQIHLGSDYAALLVKPSFHAPATVPDLSQLKSGTVAIAKVEGRR
jgi:hypothetical protein